MLENLYQTVDAGDTLSDSGCMSLPIRQQMQETLFQTEDAGVYQTVDVGAYQTADVGAYQTADAGDSLSDSG